VSAFDTLMNVCFSLAYMRRLVDVSLYSVTLWFLYTVQCK